MIATIKGEYAILWYSESFSLPYETVISGFLSEITISYSEFNPASFNAFVKASSILAGASTLKSFLEVDAHFIKLMLIMQTITINIDTKYFFIFITIFLSSHKKFLMNL